MAGYQTGALWLTEVSHIPPVVPGFSASHVVLFDRLNRFHTPDSLFPPRGTRHPAGQGSETFRNDTPHAGNPTETVGFFVSLFACRKSIVLNYRPVCGLVPKGYAFGLVRSRIKTFDRMDPILLFLILCAAGALCYWFFFKCIDWFDKI